MNRNQEFSKLLVLMVSVLILISAFGTLPLKDIGTETEPSPSNEVIEVETPNEIAKVSKSHGTRAGSPRTVLAELFTEWDCGPCAVANPAINELLDVYNSSQLVMIAYHVWWPAGANDPFYLHNTADVQNRVNYYGVNWVPYMMFDGPPEVSDGYSNYKSIVQAELSIQSPVAITLEGYLGPTNGVVNATIEVTDPLPAGSLKVRFAVVEDNKYAMGGNGEPRHRYVMRKMLNEETLPPLIVGESHSVSRSFSLSGVWDLDTISVVVFVQNDNDKDVLQAATYDYIPQKILVVDDDASGHPDGYEDSYHELLCQLGYSFDGWVLNERGAPTSSDLMPYETVIWITAMQSSSTLTFADQNAISTYLDSGTGSLFLCGEGVGNDIGSSPFFQNYLHANFGTDDTNENQITGVDDDPISDPFFGTDLPIVGPSPSEITPASFATTVFHYASSGKSAAIRAAHDLDSRIVYFGFMYFEGSDSASNKMTVLENVLNWINIEVDYIVIRDGPGETGNIVTSKMLNITKNATLWAACYNFSLGFMENSDFTIWTEDSLGSIITVTSPGDSTLVQAGINDGIATITADYFGLQNTTKITVPSIDYIVIRDGPDETGNIVTSMMLNITKNATLWAACYNFSLGFIINSDLTIWTEDSLGSIITVTSPGASTFVQAGIIGGIATITADYFGLQNTTQIAVPTVDQITLTSTPDGFELITVTMGATDQVKAYASGYNATIGYVGLIGVNWNEPAGLGLLDNLTGTSTTFTAGIVGGLTAITGENDTYGISDSFDLNLTTATADYIQIRNSQFGLGDIITSITLDVGGSTQLWAAAYNNSAGHIGDKAATIWSENSSGSVITVETQGASTIVQAQFIGGVSTITADFEGVQNTTTVIVNPPTVDNILIRNEPNGGGVNLCDPANYTEYPVGYTTIFYGAEYNNTADFIGDVPATTSIWESSNQNLVSTSSPGSFSNIACSNTTGGPVTITLYASGYVRSTTITVLPPSIDFIVIRDSPDGLGKAVSSPIYDVSEEHNYYVASYNLTAEYLEDVIATWHCTNELVGNITVSGESALFNTRGVGSCIVTAEFDGKDCSTGTITVMDLTPPIADAGSGGVVDEDTSFEFNGSASQDIAGIIDYHWSFGDGNYSNAPEPITSHLYKDPGVYTVTLTVTDIGGNTATDEIMVTVLDVTPPVALANLQDFALENAPCSFDGSDSYDNVAIIKYKWRFGDGSIYYGIYPSVTHIYEKVGNYTVSLKVEDAAGHSDMTSSYIIVKDLTPPSIPKALRVKQVESGGALIIEWNAVTDPDMDHYELYYSEDEGNYTKIDDIDGTTYTHENLENGDSYRYYIIAVDSSENPSPPSVEIEGIPDVDSDSDNIFDLADYDDDNDGLPDDKEHEVGSDPLNPDSDGDSHLDGEDAFPTDSKEWKDLDQDGYGDTHADAFPTDAKEWKDSDGDGIGDKSDFLPSVHNILFFVIIAVIAVVAIVGTIMMLKKRGKGGAETFSPELEQSPAPATPSQTQFEQTAPQPSSKSTPPQSPSEPAPSQVPSELKPSQSGSKSLPSPPRSK